jgi:hypothetical protein
MKPVSLLLLGLLGVATTTARAQRPTPISPDIETVASGGYWERDQETRGHFRAVISTGGFEHIISDLTVEWIAEPTASDTPSHRILAREVPEVADGGVHLTDPAFTLEGSRWILTIDAVNTHCDPALIERWRVALGTPGDVTILGSVVVQKGCD